MNNKIHKWNESKGVSEYISPSGNTVLHQMLIWGYLELTVLRLIMMERLFYVNMETGDLHQLRMCADNPDFGI